MVGDCEGVQTEARRLLDEALRRARAVEEAVVGVRVQFGVSHQPGVGCELERRCLVRLTLPAPGGESPPSAPTGGEPGRDRSVSARSSSDHFTGGLLKPISRTELLPTSRPRRVRAATHNPCRPRPGSGARDALCQRSTSVRRAATVLPRQ